MPWKEMDLWMRLPRHLNTVPFYRVVDELEGHPGQHQSHHISSCCKDDKERRAGDLRDSHPDDVPEATDWPTRPKPPLHTICVRDAQGQPVYIDADGW